MHFTIKEDKVEQLTADLYNFEADISGNYYGA